MLVRASIGTLAVLGLERIPLAARPTTAYLLQYSPQGCMARCMFCSQSVFSRAGRSLLSRVTWPVVRLGDILSRWRRGLFARVCIQTVLRPGFACEAYKLLEGLRRVDPDTPASVTTTPVAAGVLEAWRRLGVDTLGVGLDAASPRVFAEAGKPYSWSTYIGFIGRAVGVYGRGRVYVHLVAGLGETPAEMLKAMKLIYSLGARVALFSYTRVPGTPRRFPGVDIHTYRVYQVARLLLEEGLDPLDYIDPGPPARFARRPPVDPLPGLLTSGCPGCNRPFYNESPRGPIYNYPSARLLQRDRGLLEEQLRRIGLG
ncbi:hypothetical protein CF15_05010 [Pyrodictium occultum]|uniref:Radical SAM core domain-containing protein n=1 Tax=Pyrodictium occultum TaxID=2309 RepID=A0A0V8RVQ9_PYROC|nr:radical SAM protein [Pyrodictium occultum]KSW12129.1 hypothetical protein CF15_05010 [Pyrodictium occultum]